MGLRQKNGMQEVRKMQMRRHLQDQTKARQEAPIYFPCPCDMVSEWQVPMLYQRNSSREAEKRERREAPRLQKKGKPWWVQQAGTKIGGTEEVACSTSGNLQNYLNIIHETFPLKVLEKLRSSLLALQCAMSLTLLSFLRPRELCEQPETQKDLSKNMVSLRLVF